MANDINVCVCSLLSLSFSYHSATPQFAHKLAMLNVVMNEDLNAFP